MRLFHYTMLMNLPAILENGILASGETPAGKPGIAYCDVLKAVNLTTNGDRDTQDRIWSFGEKTEIRFTIERDAARLLSFRQFRDKYGIPSKSLKCLCPIEERKHWYYAMETIPAAEIAAVETWDQSRNSFHQLSTGETQELSLRVKTEIDRAITVEVVPFGRLKGARGYRLKDGIDSTWLMPELSRPTLTNSAAA